VRNVAVPECPSESYLVLVLWWFVYLVQFLMKKEYIFLRPYNADFGKGEDSLHF